MKVKKVLIYGLKKERITYFKNSKNKIYQKNFPLCIDFYNNEISRIIEKEWTKYILEEYREWGLWGDYFELMQKNSKNELKIIYKEWIGHKNEFSEYLHIVRGCKIGLGIAENNPYVEIHFCVDNIDLEAVVSKKEPLGKSITSSELRYVYRNWKTIKEKVFFLKNDERVKAPWEEDPELWKKYIPKKWQLKKCVESKEEKHSSETTKERKMTDILTEVSEKQQQFNQHLSNFKIRKKANFQQAIFKDDVSK